jgi:predicted transcriptional regulator of viral defense system
MSDVDLLELAGHQHGYFTTAQAETAGISRRALVGREHRGLIERAAHGLYRLRQYPMTSMDNFYALQASVPAATFSHDTALELYALSDVLPTTIHVTVPPESGLKPRPGITVHRSRIDPRDRTLRDDLWLTSLARTLLDCARAGTDAEQLLAALAAGRELGLLPPETLARLDGVCPFAGRIW